MMHPESVVYVGLQLREVGRIMVKGSWQGYG